MKSHHGASCRVTEDHIEKTTERVQPLRVAARRQRELLRVMAFQEMEWAMKLMWKILISQILLIMKMKVNSVLQSLILMNSFQTGLMKLRTTCIDTVLLVKY